MLEEYNYIWKERNLDIKTDENGEIEGVDFDWVELPDWDNPSKLIKIKRYKSLEGKL